MTNLRSWLHRSPQPVKVTARLRNGDEKTVRIGATRSKWRDAEAALKTAVYCEALDEAGEILRAWEEESEETTQRSAAGKETQLAELARLLVEAGDVGAQRQAEAYQLAFEQQSRLVQIIFERLAGLERVWGSQFTETPAQKPPEGNDALVTAFLGQVTAHLASGGQLFGTGGKEPNGSG